MDHHHLTSLVAAIGIVLFTLIGGAATMFIVIPAAKRARAKDFDFVESARRIRTMPVPARDDA